MSTVQEHQEQLASVSSKNPEVTEMAGQIHEYTELCMRGEISREEYVELIKDIQRQLNINQHMVEQDNLILMNTAINGLINLASLA
jgi:metal-dependent amidase/aminoacylase/carboxypeptidase family protein